MPELQEVLPKYLQVAAHYRDLILGGSLKVGDELPSERQLAAQWGISRPTATRALAALRSQGLAESRQGSGTYVSEPVLFNRRAQDRYLRSRQAGRIYGPSQRAEILEAGAAELPAWVAETFGVERGTKGVGRRRLTLDNDEPIEVSTSWFSSAIAAKAPALRRAGRIREGTLAHVERETGRTAAYARDLLSARMATDQERRELRIDLNKAAVLVVHHVVFDSSDAPLECVEAVYPPDHWTFQQEYRVQ